MRTNKNKIERIFLDWNCREIGKALESPRSRMCSSEAADGLRQRAFAGGSVGASSSPAQTPGGSHAHPTHMKRSPSAERLGGGLLHRPRYEPGEVRVRLTQMRDFLHVLQSRYMDTFFRLFVFVCCVQLLPTLLKVSHASGASLSGLTGALAELRVLDAVSMFYTELGWAGPSVLGVILTLLLRRRRTTYL